MTVIVGVAEGRNVRVAFGVFVAVGVIIVVDGANEGITVAFPAQLGLRNNTIRKTVNDILS